MEDVGKARAPVRVKAADEMFCPSCGNIIKKEAEICIKCGVRVNHSQATTLPDTRKDKTVAVLLAVFLGFWTWCYTYKKDSSKFWINLILSIVTLGFWYVVSWIWAIIDSASKSDEYYKRFPN